MRGAIPLGKAVAVNIADLHPVVEVTIQPPEVVGRQPGRIAAGTAHQECELAQERFAVFLVFQRSPARFGHRRIGHDAAANKPILALRSQEHLNPADGRLVESVVEQRQRIEVQVPIVQRAPISAGINEPGSRLAVEPLALHQPPIGCGQGLRRGRRRRMARAIGPTGPMGA